MLILVLIVIAGFVLLIKGADWLVTGASALTKKYNVSDLVIGLTIVSFGTSAPELVVNSVASYQQHSDIVFGNILGSNIVNLFLILGITGLVNPILVHTNTVWKEIPVSVLAILVLYFLSNSIFPGQSNILTRVDGLILLSFFGAFLYYIYRQMKADRNDPESLSIHNLSGWKIALLIVTGLAGLIFGGKLVVDSAVEIATELGISEKIIGLTIIAIGTSLPELMTSVVAAIRKNSDIALGNIIGSNIFNIFFILSISSVINPVQFNTSFNFELYMLAGGTLVLFLTMFTGGKKRLDRWEALILLSIYIIYTVYLILREVGFGI